MGELLREANSAFRRGLVEGPAWRRLQQHKQRRALFYWVSAAGTVAFFTAIVVVGVISRPGPRMTTLTPEPVPIPTTAQHTAAPPALPAPALSAEGPALAAEAKVEMPQRGAPRVQRSAPVLRTASAPAVARSAARRDDAACRDLALRSEHRAAFACFQELAQGTGIAAEVGAYEAARLSLELLGEGPRSVALLDEHRRRFPSSALRGEVDWLKVRALQQVGRLDEALALSEELLATPAGRPIASELHLLRGRVYEDQGDCARAVSEYVSLVGEPGESGDEAEFRRARCLESLGRRTDALSAYERYLGRADARRRSSASERSLALRRAESEESAAEAEKGGI